MINDFVERNPNLEIAEIFSLRPSDDALPWGIEHPGDLYPQNSALLESHVRVEAHPGIADIAARRPFLDDKTVNGDGVNKGKVDAPPVVSPSLSQHAPSPPDEARVTTILGNKVPSIRERPNPTTPPILENSIRKALSRVKRGHPVESVQFIRQILYSIEQSS